MVQFLLYYCFWSVVNLISKKDRNTYTSGKDLMGLARANNGEKMTQREVASAAGLTAVTIRCRLKEISKYLESFSNRREE
jgi:transcription initiation factor TFIIIB Brf1 subunit/transcription initiation factor TFIIB